MTDNSRNTVTMESLVDILHQENCSCVISSGDRIIICRERGVKDLFRLLNSEPSSLKDALIADKVIGKGAAALMVVGKVSGVYAGVISHPALDLLRSEGITVSFGKCVPNIINRAGTGICPVETICLKASSAEECLPLIADFIRKMN